MQDDKRLKDWYLEFSEDNENGFIITCKDESEAFINNISLSKKICTSLGVNTFIKCNICRESFDVGSNIHAIITLKNE